jgi:hypothetical protein
MELTASLACQSSNSKVASATKDGADIELIKFEDPSIPIGVRHICALVPDVPKVALELSQQDVEVVRPLAQNSLGVWYTMIRDPNGIIIEFLDPSHKNLPSAWRPLKRQSCTVPPAIWLCSLLLSRIVASIDSIQGGSL